MDAGDVGFVQQRLNGVVVASVVKWWLRMRETKPDGACLTHRPPREGRPWQRADDGYRTCADCAARLHRWLSPLTVDDENRPDNVVVLYAQLDPRPGNGGHGRRAPGFGSRSPASDHVVAMRDPRTTSVDPGDPCSAEAVLRSWVTYVWDERYDDAALDQRDYQRRRRELPRTVEDTARWLDRNLDWLSRQEIVSEFYAELAELIRQLRAMAGERRWPVGSCPNTIDEGDHTRLCGVNLFAPLKGSSICCGGCGREWDRDEWLRLGDLLGV